MSVVTETICDQCGARKSKGDVWYQAVVHRNYGFHLYTDKADPCDDGLKDICSDGCALRAYSTFLDEVRNQEVDHYREVGMSNG